MPNQIVIVGTGLAGYMLAKEVRKRDDAVSLTLITKSDGYFYSKPLLSTALTNQKTSDQLCINTVAEMRLQLNADILVQTTVLDIQKKEKKIVVRSSEGVEKIIAYDQLVLATGANHRVLSIAGDGAASVLSVNDLEEYRIFQRKIAHQKNILIIGAGLVGCEFANDLVNANYAVSMVSLDQYLLSAFVPKEIGMAVERAFLNAGIVFHRGKTVQSINRDQNQFNVTLSDNTVVEADVIFSAIGIYPDVTLAQLAGLEINRGIKTNALMQTSDPHVYALGDCAEVMGELKMYVAPILNQARVLSALLCGDQSALNTAVMPVVVKTPLCPVVVLLPPKERVGEWKTTGDHLNIKSLYYDQHNQLCGFALSGDCVKEKAQWIKCLNSEK